MKILILIAYFCLISESYAKINKVFDTKLKKFTTYEQFIGALPDYGLIVLGEFHNNTSIQDAQAQIIQDKVLESSMQGRFKIMWEFLNFTDQEKIQKEFLKLLKGQVSAEKFVENTAGARNLSYAPLFSAASIYGGDVIGVNLPRELKKKVMEGGIGAIDPRFIPPHHHLGEKDYFERFKKAMGGHANEDMIKKYFLAQSLTDSVMSYQTYQNVEGLSFLVAGSFHTDFFDGTVKMYKELSSEVLTTLKLVDEKIARKEELLNYKQGDPKYGAYADFIIFTN